MILVESNAHTSSYFRVWDLNTLMGLPTVRDHVNELDAPPLFSQALSFKWYPGSAICVSAHASPLQENLYTIWVSVVLGGVIIIHKYHLSVIAPRRLSFSRMFSQPLVLWENYFRNDSRISYAGHVNVLSRIGYDRQILPLAQWISDFPGLKPPSKKWRKASKYVLDVDSFLSVLSVRYEEKLQVGTPSHSTIPPLLKCPCTTIGL
jgi:hypothetical protein